MPQALSELNVLPVSLCNVNWVGPDFPSYEKPLVGLILLIIKGAAIRFSALTMSHSYNIIVNLISGLGPVSGYLVH